MKTLGIVQARMGSTRLPGKAMIQIEGIPSLGWVVHALQKARGIDEVMIATSDKLADDEIANYGKRIGVSVFRGPEDDVLSRYMGAAQQADADLIIRTTGDCTFLDPDVVSQVIALQKIRKVDYACNTEAPTYPDGLDTEIFTRSTLECAYREATRETDRTCVTRFIVRNRHRFSAANLVCPLPDLHHHRWVLDSPEDLEFIRQVAARLARTGDHPNLVGILAVLDAEPVLREINSRYQRNERFYTDLMVEQDRKRSYSASKAQLAKAEALIPLGAQTFSKSKLMFPEGVAPLFVTHGDGGYVFDVDGNDYVDLVGALLPNILGYRDPDVDSAIRNQLCSGISFSLATPLEEELAEKLNYHIPSAEMVRFGKNGSDVTTAAVRLARHVTGRDKVFVGGYHGWHDWSAPNQTGVPAQVQSLSQKIGMGNFDEIAAVILEPEFFSHNELRAWRDLCDREGCVLVFDEIISGFRCGMGGLQKVVGVTPDLSTFGKAMANGMPISALVGLEKYMKRMPEISYSGTFFGETLSIAAAIATIDKLAALEVPEYLHKAGIYLKGEVEALMGKHKFYKMQIHGEPCLNRIKFEDTALQSLFIQEMAKNGVLIIGSHNICFAHKRPELDKVIKAWDLTLEAIASGAELEGKIIKGKAIR